MTDGKMDSSQYLARERTDWAFERTQMASTRTFFALLRTGLAIAGGGTAITSILAKDYPEWVIAVLSGVFIVVGFSIMIGGLRRYHEIANRLAVDDSMQPLPTRLLTVVTVILQIVTIIVLALFLFR